MFSQTLAAASVSEQLPRAAVRVPRASRDFRFICLFASIRQHNESVLFFQRLSAFMQILDTTLCK